MGVCVCAVDGLSAGENPENRYRDDHVFIGTDDSHLGVARIGRNHRLAGGVTILVELDAEKTEPMLVSMLFPPPTALKRLREPDPERTPTRLPSPIRAGPAYWS